MTPDPRVHAPGGARGQNPGHLLKVLILSFVLELPYVDTRPTTHQKQFIFDHLVPCSVGFDASTTLDVRVHTRGWGYGSKSKTS